MPSFLWFTINLSLRTLKILPRNLNEIVRSWIRLLCGLLFGRTVNIFCLRIYTKMYKLSLIIFYFFTFVTMASFPFIEHICTVVLAVVYGAFHSIVVGRGFSVKIGRASLLLCCNQKVSPRFCEGNTQKRKRWAPSLRCPWWTTSDWASHRTLIPALNM
jgi:hypothetical protein